MPRRPFVLLFGSLGLLLGGLVGAGCTPDSSGSTASAEAPPTPDTTRQLTHTASPGPSSPPSSPTSEDDRTVAQRLKDASIAARVKQALVRNRTLRRFTFSPSAIRGRVTLRGDVNTREQYRLAERIAQRQQGVTAVTNQVTVEGRPVSTDESGDTKPDASATYHTVRQGDTLSEIAQEYGVSMERLRALNDLSGALQPGQRIRVR